MTINIMEEYNFMGEISDDGSNLIRDEGINNEADGHKNAERDRSESSRQTRQRSGILFRVLSSVDRHKERDCQDDYVQKPAIGLNGHTTRRRKPLPV